MGREMPILFVKNATTRQKDAEITYSVQMSDVSSSAAIRKKFGSFFLGSKDGRPPSLKAINIKNRTTPETKTRIDLLKLMAQRYRASNPDGRAQVIIFST